MDFRKSHLVGPASWKQLGLGVAFSFAFLFLSAGAFAAEAPESFDPTSPNEILPQGPISDFLPAAPGEPDVGFCSTWNPEFAYRGFRCCSRQISRQYASVSARRGRRRAGAQSCAPNRIKWSFCDERTDSQVAYMNDVKDGKVKDTLAVIDYAIGRSGQQSFCNSDNGFLANGRPLMPTKDNLIEIRNPARCSNFGTDSMVATLDWMGHEIKKEYSESEFKDIRLIVGDMSAPRGGCISGRFGRRAHKSHTSGIDADVAFFNPRASHRPEERFTRTFYLASNWWMLKRVFHNPYACVKVVFVDQKVINRLARFAGADPEWKKLKPFIRHVRGHRDHFHIRVGDAPGVPGCAQDPSLEPDDDISDALDASDSSADDEADEGLRSLLVDKGDEKGEAERAAEGSGTLRRLASLATGVSEANASTLPGSGPLHKQEPAVTEAFEAKFKPKHALRKRAKKRRH